MFVPIQQLPNPDDPDPNMQPPGGAGWLVEIDPTTNRVLARLKLPDSCTSPHGQAIDSEQHIAFIACMNASQPSLVRVNLQSMQTIAEAPWPLSPKPDMVVLDATLHTLYVGCAGGIAVFDEQQQAFRWLGNYTFGVNTHSIAVNEETHEIYLPLTRMGGRPILRIMRYNPQGIV